MCVRTFDAYRRQRDDAVNPPRGNSSAVAAAAGCVTRVERERDEARNVRVRLLPPFGAALCSALAIGTRLRGVCLLSRREDFLRVVMRARRGCPSAVTKRIRCWLDARVWFLNQSFE